MDLMTILLIVLGLVLLALIIVVIVRTLNYPIEAEESEALQLPDLDAESIAQRIGLATQFKTIASKDPQFTDPLPFKGLHELLRTLYPQLEEKLEREVINRHALLYTWQGRDPSLEGICLMAHQDVVPANEDPDSGWTYPPYSGTVADGYVWGRGTLDCKGSMITILEAVNNLVKSGFVPERNVYLAFGDDEEVSGLQGAKQIVKVMQERGVRLSFVIDEGGAVTSGVLPGIESPVAAIGIGEKGYLTLRLRSKVAPGHSSTPPQKTAVGTLALAIAALESNPFPQNTDLMQFVLSFVGSELPFTQRMALANPWLFGGILKKRLAANPNTNALTRTTIAPTVIKGGHTENVLPAEAEALVNLRVLTGETVQETFEHVREIVGDGAVEVLPAHSDTVMDGHAWDPSPLADINTPQFARLEHLIRSAFPGVKVVPNVVTGGTDARYFTALTRNCFRFSPYFLTREDLNTVHGIDERLSVVNAGRMAAFYQMLIQQLSSMTAADEAAELADYEDEEDAEEELAVTITETEPEPEVSPRAGRSDRQLPPAQQEFYPQDESLPDAVGSAEERLSDTEEALAAGTAIPLTETEADPRFMEPLPDDDEPLNVRPMKKKG